MDCITVSYLSLARWALGFGVRYTLVIDYTFTVTDFQQVPSTLFSRSSEPF